MVELIGKELRGEATDIERRRLERWRAASPENEQEYAEALRLWQRSGELTMPAVPPPPSLSRIVEVAEARRRRAGTRATGRAVLSSPWLSYGLAAAALLAALFIGVRSTDDPVVAGVGLTPVESSSGPNQMVTMSLSDGSVVRVAPETMLEFLPGAGRREVALEGRAFFAVAEDEIPFVVRTPMGDVTVLGTRFEVMTDAEGLRLVVVEGSVELRNEHGSAEVGAGQVAFLTEGSTARIVHRERVWEILDWSGGLLLFQSTPLSQVAEELGRHFGRAVRVTDQELLGLRITAWFEDESVEEVVSAVCIVAGARCQVDESEVTIGR